MKVPKEIVETLLKESGMPPEIAMLFASTMLSISQQYALQAIRMGAVPTLDGLIEFLTFVKEATEEMKK